MNKSEEYRIIKHEWLQVLVMAVTVSGLFLWNHSEMHSNERQTKAIIEAIRQDAKEFREKWANESLEFHGRLATMEERFSWKTMCYRRKE